MPKFRLIWSERRQAVIDAENEEEAMAIYGAGDYDSEYLYEHDFSVEKEETDLTNKAD